MANVANGRKAVPARRVKRADELLTRIADWLRDSKASGLPAREAVQYEKRVDYFKGTKLVEVLLSERFKSQKGFPTMGSRQDAIGLAGTLMRSQFFHRSQRVFISARRWELEAHPGAFEEDGLYTWLHEGSKTRLYLLTGLFLAGALMVCMIQIWPIWMKIGLWWCSVTFLTTFSALCVVRFALFCAMFAVGFRDIWLFPNLFDDNQTFAGSFMPILGKATPVAQADEYDSDDDELRTLRTKKKKSDEDSDKASSSTASAKEAASKGASRPDESSYRFGLVNAVVLGLIGLIVCWNIGLFEGDNVPDFVAKHDDLQYYFPGIAPPEETGEGAAGGGEGDANEERDPFAAPDEDGDRDF